jgi:hypothetical protein
MRAELSHVLLHLAVARSSPKVNLDLSQRQTFAVHLPPHVSPMGLRFGGHQGDCPGTEDLADRLLRFPFFNGMRMAQTLATHFDGPVHVSNYPVHRALHKRLKKFRRKTLLS